MLCPKAATQWQGVETGVRTGVETLQTLESPLETSQTGLKRESLVGSIGTGVAGSTFKAVIGVHWTPQEFLEKPRESKHPRCLVDGFPAWKITIACGVGHACPCLHGLRPYPGHGPLSVDVGVGTRAAPGKALP